MNIKPIRLKSLLFWVGTSLLAGGVSALLGGSMDKYQNLTRPPLSPPSILFPIVWGILYLLIGIGAYILSGEKNRLSETALKFYWAQLILNSLWSLIFWRLEAFTFAAIWLALIIFLTAVLLFLSSKINKKAFYCFLPYLLWLCFALYLNIGIAVLN